MAKLFNSISDLIGKTPLLQLNNTQKLYNLSANLIAKLEMFNPAGSSKDRVAKSMLDDAEKQGLINGETVIIEPTSGNTGIGLSAVASSRGYKTIIVMPDNMSAERCKLLKAYGAELVLTSGKDGMKGAISKAEELHKKIPNSLVAGQFENPSNPQIHYDTTGPEIYEDLNGNVDIFIAGVGTGGTITGVGKYLKEKNPNVKIIAVEPLSSPYLSKGVSSTHAIQGIGAGFIPKVLNTSIYDEVIAVSDSDALNIGKNFGKTEGFLIGISSSAVLYAGIEVAKRPENKNKNIVMLFPDSGDRYLSSKMYEE